MAAFVRSIRGILKRRDTDAGAAHADRLREFTAMLREESAMAITPGHA